ncbi:hypothetical protein EDD92_1032 [Streptomyces sp. TLI_185]|nr:hypothetical protein EDD92_1032 [Streptomyces sp. TLI_185]
MPGARRCGRCLLLFRQSEKGVRRAASQVLRSERERRPAGPVLGPQARVHRSPGRYREADSCRAGRAHCRATGTLTGPASGRRAANAHATTSTGAGRRTPAPGRKPRRTSPLPIDQPRRQTPHACARPQTHAPTSGPVPANGRLPRTARPAAQAPMPVNQRRRRTPHTCARPQPQAPRRASQRTPPHIASPGAQAPCPSTSPGARHRMPAPGRKPRRQAANPRATPCQQRTPRQAASPGAGRSREKRGPQRRMPYRAAEPGAGPQAPVPARTSVARRVERAGIRRQARAPRPAGILGRSVVREQFHRCGDHVHEGVAA